MLKLLLLAMTLYAFGPVPSPAMHYLVEDMDGMSPQDLARPPG
jgi:hypothetical protein